MSADNGIFIFKTPYNQFGVIEATMSEMPMALPDILKDNKNYMGNHLFLFRTFDEANKKALEIRRELFDQKEILEYGIVDWTDVEYLELMADYL